MQLPNITTTLLIATARITNPNLTDSEFNNWYNNVLLPGFMQNHNASLGLRYKVIANTSAPHLPPWQYLALYKTHGNVSFTSQSMAVSDITPDDVTIEFSAWSPIQVFEGLGEKKGLVPAGRPKVAVVVKIEPRDGEEGARELEEWYRKQHLDMLSMLKNYRRSTRYKSADGSKPHWLAIHEMDSEDVEAYLAEVLMGTEMARRVMDGVQVFDAAKWELIFEKGNTTEKL